MQKFQSSVAYFGVLFGVLWSCSTETAHPSPSNLAKELVSECSVRSAKHMRPGTTSTKLVHRWPRGRRAGIKVKAEEMRKTFTIPVLISSRVTYVNSSSFQRASVNELIPPRVSYANSSSFRKANLNNLIPVQARKQTFASTHYVPSIMLSNPMSLVPKLCEVQELILRQNIQIGCIVESWLKPHISDTVVNIEGYNIGRKDRSSHEHGGVCAYIKEDIKYQLAKDLNCCDDHEIIWIKLNPTRLPRSFSCIVLAVVYYPGPTSPAESDAQRILNHLFDSLMKAESQFPNCGIVVSGDFNRLNTSRLQNHFKLKQLVKFPTRGQATLDLVLTNMADNFSSPVGFPPFGLSDHITVIVKPKTRQAYQNTRVSITTRDTRESKKVCLGRYLSNVDWSCIYNYDECEEKLSAFNKIIKIGIDNILPQRTVKVHPKDAPWMTVKLKKTYTNAPGSVPL